MARPFAEAPPVHVDPRSMPQIRGTGRRIFGIQLVLALPTVTQIKRDRPEIR
jgi:hypothetical protein